MTNYPFASPSRISVKDADIGTSFAAGMLLRVMTISRSYPDSSVSIRLEMEDLA